MIKSLSKTFKQKKKTFMISMVVAAIMAIGTSAGAAADTATVTSVTDQMTAIKDTAIAILASVAGIAILLFGGIYGWRYGKQVFKIIAK